MIFNSLDFAVFLPVVFIVYWFFTKQNARLQNLVLVLAGYVFYGWWDWRFLFLLLFNSIFNYLIGAGFSYNAEKVKRKKYLLYLGVTINILVLVYFKYFNFFIDSFVSVFSLFGSKINTTSLNIILPIGLSFYTFQSIGYLIDTYHDRFKPATNFIDFSAFMAFFPILLAGPIERAGNLLKQIYSKRNIDSDKAIDGCFQILWGLFKKIVIADNAANLVNAIMKNDSATGSVLYLGIILMAFQIYCDFSGYSDIALGAAKLFGINLTLNFRYPYFASDIADFWRRWHISLSNWLRDFIFLPIAYKVARLLNNKKLLGVKAENWSFHTANLITMTICGLWHGANWTFVLWGFLHGAGMSVNRFINSKFRKKRGKIVKFLIGFITFNFVSFLWVFFNSSSIQAAILYIKGVFSKSLFTIPKLTGEQNTTLFIFAVTVLLMFIIEIVYNKESFVFEGIYKKNLSLQLVVLVSFVTVIFYLGGSQQSFIYFQF